MRGRGRKPPVYSRKSGDSLAGNRGAIFMAGEEGDRKKEADGGKWRMMPHVQKREGISMKTVI